LDAPPPRYTNVSLYWVAQVRRGGPPPGGTYRCGYRADGRYRHLSGRGAGTWPRFSRPGRCGFPGQRCRRRRTSSADCRLCRRRWNGRMWAARRW